MGEASANLLRLLEPSVRPGGLPPRAAGPTASVPFERQSFASLLAEHGVDPTATSSGTPVATNPPVEADRAGSAGPLESLNGFDRIENPSLRNLLAAARPAA